MKNSHLNYVILHDGKMYHLFERLGKDVPFDAYNPSKAIFSSETVGAIFNFAKTGIKKPENSEIDFPENLGSLESKSWGSLGIENSENSDFKKVKSLGNTGIDYHRPRAYEIEQKPYEVMFNE